MMKTPTRSMCFDWVSFKVVLCFTFACSVSVHRQCYALPEITELNQIFSVFTDFLINLEQGKV